MNPYDEFSSPADDYDSFSSPVNQTGYMGNSQNKLNSFTGGLNDMASVGLDDEIRGLGYALASKLRGAPSGDLISQGIDRARSERDAAKEANPKTYLGGQVAGAVIPAFISGGQSVLPRLASDTLGKTALKSAATGAVSGGAYGFNSEDGGLVDRAKTGAESAAIGGVTGGLIPYAGQGLKSAAAGSKNVVKGFSARGADALDQAIEGMRNASSSNYQLMDQLGATIKPGAAQGLASSLNGVIKNPQTKASQALYGDTMKAIDDLATDLQNGNTSLSTLDQHRQILGNIAKNKFNPNQAQEAKAASDAIDHLDDFIEQLDASHLSSGDIAAVDALNKARAGWRSMKKFETVTDAIKNSGGDANKLKNNLDRLLNNKKKTMGWTKDELDALKYASQNSTGEGVLKLAGKFGIDLGSARAAGSSGIGAALLSGLTAAKTGAATGGASLAAGTGARAAQKMIARAKAEDLLKVIEGGGVSQVPKAIPSQTQLRLMQLYQGIPQAAGRSPIALQEFYK